MMTSQMSQKTTRRPETEQLAFAGFDADEVPPQGGTLLYLTFKRVERCMPMRSLAFRVAVQSIVAPRTILEFPCGTIAGGTNRFH